MEKIKLTNGKILNPMPSSFKKANRLKKIFLTEVTKEKLPISFTDLKKELKSEDIEKLIAFILNLDASEELENAILDCSDKSLIDGERISLEFFENVENWEILSEIKLELLKVNLLPFFKSLPMLLGRLEA